jgi:predicted nucleotidyltransferase
MSVVNDLKQQLGAMPNVLLAVLYGSTARGAAGTASDCDLGLLLADNDLGSRYAAEAALQRAIARAVHVVYLDEAPPLLRFEIARDGLLLEEKEPHRWQDFKARAMVDWWDWAPTAARLHAACAERLREKITRGQA